MASEYICGLMGENMKATGRMENKMEKENIHLLIKKLEKVYGKMEKE